VRVSEFLSEGMILPDLAASSKDGVLAEVVAHLCAEMPGLRGNDERIVRALLDRERLGSTGVGEGVAIPHAKIAGLTQLVAAFGRSTSGVAFEAIDNKPVYLVFMLLVPESSAGLHLKALARISRLLKSHDFRSLLMRTQSRTALYEAFLSEDARC
jgi:nitrogen PTS system EIIA component